MESTARRSFLMGRRQPLHPWQQFVRQLAGRVEGELADFGFHDEAGNARLRPRTGADVREARALCARAGVTLALAGVEQGDALAGRSVLWVEPDLLATLQPVPEQAGRWFVQPGCTVRQLAEAGLVQFEHFPPYLTAAAWLADRVLGNWLAGATAASGLLTASVLLDDGTVGTLGPFGRGSRLALTSARLQRCIPALFQLARSAAATNARQHARWPARYRLDALLADNDDAVNLAHLLIGHGGDLAWVEWMVFESVAAAPPSGPPFTLSATGTRPGLEGQPATVAELDYQVKQTMDPQGVFPVFNQML